MTKDVAMSIKSMIQNLGSLPDGPAYTNVVPQLSVHSGEVRQEDCYKLCYKDN